MENIIKYVNTLFLVYLFANPGTRNIIMTNLKIFGCFLLKGIDDMFKRQDDFLEFLVTGVKKDDIDNLIVDKDLLEEEVKDQVEELEQKEEPKVEQKEEPKAEEKFEDKYLAKFKAFKNEYSFTIDELQMEQQKYSELKTSFINNRTKEIEVLTWKITKIQRIFDCITFDENGSMTDISDDAITRLVRYYDIEEEYEDDPENYMLSDLFAELSEILAETKQKLKEQEDQIVNDDEFKEQAHQYMLNKKLDGYINNYINEMTPLGNVYMRYNNTKKSFEYYSNNTIPYRYLEPIGRKYVMTYFCKPLFVDIEDELNKAKLKKEEEKESKEKEQKESKEKGQKEPNDVFARLKSYNSATNNNSEMSKMGKQNALPPQIKANLPNVNTTNNPEDMLLKENANRYTWEGRLTNMNLLKKVDRKTVDKTYAMSFADFKRLRQQF